MLEFIFVFTQTIVYLAGFFAITSLLYLGGNFIWLYLKISQEKRKRLAADKYKRGYGYYKDQG